MKELKPKKFTYQVFDNGKPADYKHFPVDKTWDQSIHKSFIGAFIYCQNWLGQFRDLAPKKVNTPIDYSGYGDTIEIRRYLNQ